MDISYDDGSQASHHDPITEWAMCVCVCEQHNIVDVLCFTATLTNIQVTNAVILSQLFVIFISWSAVIAIS